MVGRQVREAIQNVVVDVKKERAPSEGLVKNPLQKQ